jgi:hypothetical protein
MSKGVALNNFRSVLRIAGYLSHKRFFATHAPRSLKKHEIDTDGRDGNVALVASSFKCQFNPQHRSKSCVLQNVQNYSA